MGHRTGLMARVAAAAAGCQGVAAGIRRGSAAPQPVAGNLLLAAAGHLSASVGHPEAAAGYPEAAAVQLAATAGY